MRSPNKRSRSKSNRPKTLGNIINRVFDSSGPEGKVRGTPQQIIEKYQVLARDAQLSNDRVAAENFQQHAEHYTRLLAQAQREMQAEQEARRQANEERNAERQQDRAQGNGQQPHQQSRRDTARHGTETDAPVSTAMRDTASQSSFSVQEDDEKSGQTSLVETPESKADAPVDQPAPQGASAPAAKAARKPRAPRRSVNMTTDATSEDASAANPRGADQDAVSEDAPPAPVKAPRRYARRPRKAPDAAADTPAPSQSAAE